jgi:hypothetical protein
VAEHLLNLILLLALSGRVDVILGYVGVVVKRFKVLNIVYIVGYFTATTGYAQRVIVVS